MLSHVPPRSIALHIRLRAPRRGTKAFIDTEKEEVSVTYERDERQAPDDAPVHGGEGDPLGEGVAEATDEDQEDANDRGGRDS